MATTIQIKGPVLSNDQAAFYSWIGLDEDSFVSYSAIKNQLDNTFAADDVVLEINSPGGDVNAASDIYSELRKCAQNNKNTIIANITGMAASAASFIAMAADEINMAPLSKFMIHKAGAEISGNSDDMDYVSSVLNQTDEQLADVYAAKTGMDKGKILNMMAQETYISATEAVDMGFADKVIYEPSSKSGNSITNFATEFQITAMEKRASNLKLPSQEQINKFKALQDSEPNGKPGKEPEPVKPNNHKKTPREIYLANAQKLKETTNGK
ncbi:Clp protease ClpP [Fructilactobacillus myrtifloralis]|uniref:ATP-dependent Clp protease proteolytic subunit n=1 Tax=Fructilactobacillus myrtifloralis TaxID=2940301 RepID=A0ABY5BR74_9LACO|nr:head maturation protease, ClpP-related [Fructilactobacillus myrtifloralis]USS85076.1 Clp protease ClpP [Fructilactobacillus myrtifloralis]